MEWDGAEMTSDRKELMTKTEINPENAWAVLARWKVSS